MGMTHTVKLFLKTREHAIAGRSAKRAVRRGIEDTASAARSSGQFMAIAFFFLMLGSTAEIREFGFMLCFGVIIDTWLIRLCIAPCLLTILGPMAFWPMHIPTTAEMD